MERDQIINQIADSEINRPVEVAFRDDILHFAASTRYPAALRYITQNEFYLVLPVASPPRTPPYNNVFKGVQLTIFPFAVSSTVKYSTYHADYGHLLIFLNTGKLSRRRFLRVVFDEKISVSMIDETDQNEKEVDAHILDLSGAGLAFRCPREFKFTLGTVCRFKIARQDFPGYDPAQGAALLKGKVVRTFSDENRPDCENVGVQFIYDSLSEEYAQTDRLDQFCLRLAFPSNHSQRIFQDVLNLPANLNANQDIDSILFKINLFAADAVSAEVSSILLFDDDSDKSQLYFRAVSGEKPSMLNGTATSDGVEWSVSQTGDPTILNEPSSEPRFVSTLDKIPGFKAKNLIAVPIIWGKEVLGVLEAVNKLEDAQFTRTELQLFILLATQVASITKNAPMQRKYENFLTNAIEFTVQAIESVGVLMGRMSQGHCWRVASLATAIGTQFGLSGDAVDTLYYGGILHDIGFLEPKHHLPFASDFADDRLPDFGERAVEFHTIDGANMVKQIQMWQDLVPIIRHHHEHFDGSGYPDGLQGEESPLEARIIAVVEAYEEFVHQLQYGMGRNPNIVKQAGTMIKDGAGTRFDPGVVDVFTNQFLKYMTLD
jgi:putative nucleotidyltransferase with HDIG domain